MTELMNSLQWGALRAPVLVGLGLLLAAPPAFAQIQPSSAFPTSDPRDGRMLSLANGFQSLSGQRIVLGLAVPPEETSFTFRIFDGDTGKACRPVDACAQPGAGHWDAGTAQIIVSMYFDPLFNPLDPAPVSDLVLMGRWFGNATNTTVDPEGRWTAEPLMPDNDFWDLAVNVTPEARAPSGTAFYRLVIRLDPSDPTSSASSFKVYSTVPIALLSENFGFIGALQQVRNDAPIIYPTWNGVLPAMGSNFWQEAVASGDTTYDGTWTFFLDVPEGQEALRLFGGDFDFGTNSLIGLPSLLPIAPCADTDDPDSVGIPDFVEDPTGVLEEGAQPFGVPPDDNNLDIFRREGCVTYTLSGPLGNVFVNSNPSGNREWEQFAIATTASGIEADFTVDLPQIPPGLWRIDIDGLDMSNLNFWRLDFLACGQIGGTPICGELPFLIGDTVFFDSNGNGSQDAGEPGIPGVKLNRIDAGGGLVDMATTDENGNYLFDVTAGSWTIEVADVNFGPVPVGALGDRVWLDLDADGLQDATEPGLSNVTVRLIDQASGLSAGVTRTDADGFYLFDGLPPGSYRAEVMESTLPVGLTQTGGSNPSDLRVISSDEVFRDLDFGYADAADGLLGDYLWRDADADGVQDAGEPGVGDVVVNLVDLGPDGIFGTPDDVLVGSQPTAANGSYLFTGLAPGVYAVEVDPASFAAGGPLAGHVVTVGPESEGANVSASRLLPPGGADVTVDFGYTAPTGLFSITDFVWLDADSNGAFDPTEMALPGVTVNLLDSGGNVIATTTSDASGAFTFSGLRTRVYTLQISDIGRRLDGLFGTTEPGLERSLLVLLEADVTGSNFGYIAGGALDGLFTSTGDALTRTIVDANDLTYDFGYFLPAGSCDQGRPVALTFRYTGDSCASPNASNNDQGGRPGTSGDYTCSGPLNGDQPLRLVVMKKAERFLVSPNDESVQVGDLITLTAVDGRRLFPAVRLELRQGAQVRQRVAIHASCSQPLVVGDQFGSLLLVGFQN